MLGVGGAGTGVKDVTDDVRVIKGIRRMGEGVGMGGEFVSKNLKGSDTHTSIQLNYLNTFFRAPLTTRQNRVFTNPFLNFHFICYNGSISVVALDMNVS